MARHFIYGLCEPDGTLRYIGKAVNVERRFAQHLREDRRDYPVYRWINKRRGEGVQIQCVVMAESLGNAWQQLEQDMIAQHRADGARLLNVADGGDQPKCSAEVRARNGRATAAAIHSNPKARRIWELKKQLGSLLRDGYVNEATKEKLRYAARKMPATFGEWLTV